MKCRAWETKHENGLTYIHVVEETVEVEVVKDIAERLAKSPCKMPMLRDVTGSYLLADKGHTSIGFSVYTPVDQSIIQDIEDVRSALDNIYSLNSASTFLLKQIAKRLSVDVERG